MKGVIMKKEELSKISDEQLNKEIDEQEDFLGDESSSTGKRRLCLIRMDVSRKRKQN